MVLCLFVAVSLHRAGLRCGLPVQDQRDRCGGGFFRQLIDQETAVARYGVLGPEQVRDASRDPRRKQGHRRCGLKVRTRRRNTCGHELSVRRDKVELFDVCAPSRLDTAVGGHLRLPFGSGNACTTISNRLESFV